MLKLGDSQVDVTNIQESGQLELRAEALTLLQRCKGVVGQLLTTLKKKQAAGGEAADGEAAGSSSQAGGTYTNKEVG